MKGMAFLEGYRLNFLDFVHYRWNCDHIPDDRLPAGAAKLHNVQETSVDLEQLAESKSKHLTASRGGLEILGHIPTNSHMFLRLIL